MDREEQSDQRTGPEFRCSCIKKQQQEHRISGMQKDIGQVKRAWQKTKDFNLHQVAQPGDRVPVREVEGRESPGNAFGIQPFLDVGIQQQIPVSIKVDEIMGSNATVEQQRDNEDEKTDPDDHGLIL